MKGKGEKKAVFTFFTKGCPLYILWVYQKYHEVDFYNVLVSQITRNWKSANSYTPRIRNGEIRMMKYLYVAITIMNNDVRVLWRGHEVGMGFLPSLGC